MNFRDAVKGLLSVKQLAKIDSLDANDRRWLWSMSERMARRQIERRTGKKLVGKIDWSKWIEFLGPIFLKLLALLLAA